LVVTLDAKDADGNNIQVTIPAGTTAGTAVTSPAFVINNAEDVYNDNSSFQVSIVSTDNNPSVDNNFEALDISDKGTVTVNDTTTEGTKVLVSDVTVNEGGTATVEVSVTADTKVALVVTLDAKDADGNNIQVTIPAGTTAGTAVTSPAFVINNAEDVYNDNSSFQVSIVSTDNNPSVDNNFEALDISDKGTVTVNDTTTEGTKVLVSDVTVNEGGTATVEVSVTADTKVALVVTLDAKDADGNNIQVTIPAGTTAGTAVTSPAFVINNAEDVYNDNSSFQVSIVSTDNNPSVDNNFEALDISDKGTVTVNDTTTEGTKVLVSDVTVNEGGTATVEVSVTADTKVALVVTLDAKDADGNNIQVTIPAGTTAGTAVTSPAFVINNAEDVYNDNSSFQVSIVSTDNNPSVDNNFEALDISDKGTVTVNDTTTEGTKVLVSDVTVNEGGTATVEVSVTADTKVALVVTLDAKDADGNNIQVTIPAGTTAGTAVTSPAFVINNAEDVYNDNSSFQVSIVSTDNNPSVDNNFEALDISDKGTVTVNDTTTEGTKVLVSDVTVNEGGTATVEVSVTADTKVALVVTLDAKDADGNNIQVTIPAGTTAGTAVTSPAFVINNAEDVYNDNSSFQVSIVSTDNNPSVDNNFEALDISDKGTVTVNDTEGTAILKINETLNNDGTYTYTAVVSNTPDVGNNLIVTLDNGQTITLSNPNLQASITAPTQVSGVTSVTGGNYENLKVIYGFGQDVIMSISSNNQIVGVDTNTDTINYEVGTGIASIKLTPQIDAGGYAVNINGDRLTSTDGIETSTPTKYYIKYETSLDSSGDTVVNAYRVSATTGTEYKTQVVFTLSPDTQTESYSIALGTYPLDGQAYSQENLFDSSNAVGGGNTNILLFNINDLYVVATATKGVNDEYTKVNYNAGNGLGVDQGASIDEKDSDTLILHFSNNKIAGQDFTSSTSLTAENYALANPTYLTSAKFSFSSFTGSDTSTWVAYKDNIQVGTGTVSAANSSSVEVNIIGGFNEIHFSAIGDKSSFLLGSMIATSTTEYDAHNNIINVAIETSDGINTSTGIMQITFDGDSALVGTDEDEVFDYSPSLSINGGAGIDTLMLSDGDDTYSLINNPNVTNIEKYDGGAGNDTLTGSDGDDKLYGGAGNDYLDGGAGADTLNGGTGDDRLLFDANDLSIDGGVGKDTLVFSLDDGNIDFSAVDNPIIKNIESIDLSAGNHEIKLSLQDVINMTDSTDKTLQIIGDTGDKVDLTGGGWTKSAPTPDLPDYDVYTNSGDASYKVLVQTQIIDTTN
jgi:hypothetical protein